uniref:Uncharacterized protein n=1 Tax=Aegilops tauschii subsp. strangulata TaxID=200361 RepID=A0A453P1A0_AEGTS
MTESKQIVILDYSDYQVQYTATYQLLKFLLQPSIYQHKKVSFAHHVYYVPLNHVYHFQVLIVQYYMKAIC